MADQSPIENTFLKRLAEAEENQRQKADKWRRWAEDYEGTSYPKATRENRGKSRIFPAWVMSQVETLKPRIMDPEPTFKYRPADPSDEPQTKILDRVIQYQLDQNGYAERQTDFIHDAMVKGVAVAKVVWAYECIEMDKRRKRTPMDLITKRSPFTTHKVVTKNWPEIVYVDPYDFFWDPGATNDRNWRYVFHRSWVTLADLEKREKDGIYSNIKELKDVIHAEGEQERDPGESVEEAKARRSDRIELIEMFERDRIVVMANRKVVVRDEANPNLHKAIPFATFSTMPRQNSIVGMSEVEKAAPIQEHMWAMRNLRIEAAKMAVSRMMILDPTIKGANEIQWRQGGKIYAGPGQRIEWIDQSINDAPSMQEEQMALGDMQSITGATPWLMGESGGGETTATTDSYRQENAGSRLNMKKAQLKIFTAKLAKLMVQLNYQYMDDEYAVRVAGPEGQEYQTVSPDDIPLVLDVRPEGIAESISKQTERNSFLELLNVTGAMEGMIAPDGTKFTNKPLISRAIRAWDMQPDEFWQQVSPQEQQSMAMQQAGMDPMAMMAPPEGMPPELAAQMQGAPPEAQAQEMVPQ